MINVADKLLVEQVLCGDERAVRQLYKQVRLRLEPLFRLRVSVSEDVDELIQDTFLHFLDALPLFRFQSSLMTFVVGIGKHELMDYWRKKYAKRAIRTVPALSSLMALPYSSGETSLRIHESMEKAYQQLKPIQIQLLRWKYEEGKSVKEMATALGWSIKAVESQLYRARKEFQAVYELVEERQ